MIDRQTKNDNKIRVDPSHLYDLPSVRSPITIDNGSIPKQNLKFLR